MLLSGKKREKREAFHELVEQTRADLYRMILGMTRNHHDAEDLLQETYLKAYAGRSTFRGEAAPKTWLYRIAVNRFLDGRRSDARKPLVLVGDEGAVVEARNPASNPQQMAEAGMLRQKMEAAMARLSPLERTIFVLRHHQELTLKETAEVVNRAEGTVKSIHFRAIRKMRDVLAPLQRKTAEPKEVRP